MTTIRYEVAIEIDDITADGFTDALSMRNYFSDRIFEQIVRMIEVHRALVHAIPDK